MSLLDYGKNFRKKRFLVFLDFISDMPRPIRILDAGGTQEYWETVGFADAPGVSFVLINIHKEVSRRKNFICLSGDATDLSRFENQSFDVVFSNSVIEHVGGHEAQKKFAQEVCRVGKRYFIQTPNRYFLVEPHFVFPFFQFLPQWVRVWIVTHFAIGNYPKFIDRDKAREEIESIELLGEHRLQSLFPESVLWKEKLFFLTKSLTVYKK